jgi:hypothetical protein
MPTTNADREPDFSVMPRLIDRTDDGSEDEDDTALPESANQAGMSRPKRAADRRNTQRLIEQDATDEKTTSKYLSSDINVLLGDAIAGPDDNFVPPDWLLEAIEAVTHSDPPRQRHPWYSLPPRRTCSTTRIYSSAMISI